MNNNTTTTDTNAAESFWAITIAVGELPRLKELDEQELSLEHLQEAVGGYVEPVSFNSKIVRTFVDLPGMTMWIHEEGKIRSLGPNIAATTICRLFQAIDPRDVIHGNVVIVANSRSYRSLGFTSNQAEKLSRALAFS